MNFKLDIKDLFGRFNYHIDFDRKMTILTGMNGYGKTTLLKIIQAIYEKNVLFFFDLYFHEITITTTKDSFSIVKNRDEIIIIKNGEKKKEISIEKTNKHLERLMSRGPFRRNGNTIIDITDGENIPINIFLQREGEKNIFTDHQNSMLELEFPVYIIREQRLYNLGKTQSEFRMRGSYRVRLSDEESIVSQETIESYSLELRNELRNIMAENSKISQNLDSSFPRRIFDANELIQMEEFQERFNKIKDTQKRLSEYSILSSPIDDSTTYKLENAKVLKVYINDTEKKLAGFEDICNKLDLFTTVISNKVFPFKKVKITPEHGIFFLSEEEKDLPLSSLSSGEKQEVVMGYELLFKTKKESLILIDEPEISLHVAWQNTFLDDLEKILDHKNCQAIIATHSPFVIGNRSSCMKDLTELYNQGNGK